MDQTLAQVLGELFRVSAALTTANEKIKTLEAENALLKGTITWQPNEERR